MIGAEGDLRVFWSNGLVGSITTLALVLLFWPLISQAAGRAIGWVRPARREAES
jgi:TctA family transporter